MYRYLCFFQVHGVILLHFVSFDIFMACTSHLSIYDGPIYDGPDSESQLRLCGIDLPSDFQSSDSSLLLHLHTEDRITWNDYNGFKLTWGKLLSPTCKPLSDVI